jgi:hypothetical protein
LQAVIRPAAIDHSVDAELLGVLAAARTPSHADTIALATQLAYTPGAHLQLSAATQCAQAFGEFRWHPMPVYIPIGAHMAQKSLALGLAEVLP